MKRSVRPRPSARAIGPRTLSPLATRCRAKGGRLNNFLPSLGHVRPAYDISRWSSTGPVACEARLELSKRTCCRVSTPSRHTSTPGASAAFPDGVKPLKMRCARPSQNERTENTASMTEGELRDVTRRTCKPPNMNSDLSSASLPSSTAWPGTISSNMRRKVPADPTRIPVSHRTWELRFPMSESIRKGKFTDANGRFTANGPLGSAIWFCGR